LFASAGVGETLARGLRTASVRRSNEVKLLLAAWRAPSAARILAGWSAR
jgi:hypothetical protein